MWALGVLVVAPSSDFFAGMPAGKVRSVTRMLKAIHAKKDRKAAAEKMKIYNSGTILSIAGDAVRLTYAEDLTATGVVINYGIIGAQDHLND